MPPEGIEHCLIGYGHLKRRDCESAVRSFAEYLNSAGSILDENLCYNLGICYKNLNESGKAVRYFTEALRLDPASARSRSEIEEMSRIAGNREASVG